MSDAKHTPGPWCIVHDELSSRLEFKGVTVAEAHQTRDYVDTDARHANARLIAAAPDLLEALRTVTAWWDVDHGDEGIGDVVENARAAIAKAEGRGP